MEADSRTLTGYACEPRPAGVVPVRRHQYDDYGAAAGNLIAVFVDPIFTDARVERYRGAGTDPQRR
jgi:hypothetical protein